MTLHHLREANTKAGEGIPGPNGEVMHHVESHRNGVGGVGFYGFSFTMGSEQAFGWLHHHDDTGDRHYGVVIPSRPAACWRGDHFVDWFEKCAARLRELQDAYFEDQALAHRLARAGEGRA